MDTVQKKAVYVKDGIKKAHTIDRMDYSQPIQPRTATPISGPSSFTIDGRTLTPKDMMIYSEVNPRNFETSFIAEDLSPTLLSRGIPATVETYMLQIALRAFEQQETGIWQGSLSYTAIPGSAGNGQLCFFDGFLKKMVNDSAVLQVSSPLPLAAETASGVYGVADAFDALISLAATNKKALLARSKRYDRMKFFISVATEQLYQTWLTTGVTFKGQNTMDRGIKPYKGYTVETLAGMADNTIVFAEGIPDTSSNLYLGINSTEDNALQLQRLQNNSELFFIKGLMKMDTQYGFSQEVFLFTTLTAASFNV